MNLEQFNQQLQNDKPKTWEYDFDAMHTWEKERMKSAEEFSMGILDEERKVTEEGLKTDKLFLDATKIAYKQMYGKMLEGSEEEIASQGMQLVSDALVPLTTVEGAGMLGIYKHFNEAHPEAKQALYYMIDSIDKKDMTFDGFMRGVKSIGKDPTTYTGVGLSYSFFGKTAAKASAKKELMKMLGEASLAGGAYMGVEEGLRQDLQGKQDLGEIATQAGIGAVAAPVMVGGVKALGVGGKKALTGVADFMHNTEQEMMKMAGGGTPPIVPINKRIKGDLLLDAEDMIEELKEVNANVDDFGYVTVYHRTSKENAEQIKKTGKMINKEKGIFVSTKKDGSQAEGYGDTVIEMKIPIEDAQIDDMFGDEAHLAIKTKTVGKPIDISKYLVQKNTNPQESLHVKKFQDDVNKISSKIGDINEQEYSMMDISNRDLTRIQRAKNTIETIKTDEEAHLLVSDFNEFMENYADQFKYAKIKPIEKGDKVKIFRSATGDIEAGDWVGLDKEYAKSHSRTKEHKLYEMWVDKKDIRWQGDDANEWIYLPKELINADIKYAPTKGQQ